MRILIFLSAILLTGCQTAPVGLVYKRYVAPRGGTIVVHRETQQTAYFAKKDKEYETKLLSDFCGSEWTIIDEGWANSGATNGSTYTTPEGLTFGGSSPIQQHYKNFVCAPAKAVPKRDTRLKPRRYSADKLLARGLAPANGLLHGVLI